MKWWADWLVDNPRDNARCPGLTPIKLYGDNQPSIQLVASEGHHERTKHANIYYYYIKDQVKDGCIVLQHVGTKDMAADGLTKPLDEIAYRRFLQQVGLRRPYLTATR